MSENKSSKVRKCFQNWCSCNGWGHMGDAYSIRHLWFGSV